MDTNPIAETLKRKIRKIDGRFRTEEELKLILKRRLTKKEYKILFAEITGYPERSELIRALRLDELRYRELQDNLEKKLNLEKIKRELFLTVKE
ncbi:hypothetical protein [Nitratifractor sp.]